MRRGFSHRGNCQRCKDFFSTVFSPDIEIPPNQGFSQGLLDWQPLLPQPSQPPSAQPEAPQPAGNGTPSLGQVNIISERCRLCLAASRKALKSQICQSSHSLGCQHDLGDVSLRSCSHLSAVRDLYTDGQMPDRPVLRTNGSDAPSTHQPCRAVTRQAGLRWRRADPPRFSFQPSGAQRCHCGQSSPAAEVGRCHRF
jgi:hypothetical protein